MRTSNPVLSRISAAAQQPRYSVPGPGADLPYQGSTATQGTVTSPVQDRVSQSPDVMSIDDVVIKTISLIGVAALVALLTAAVVPYTALFPIAIVASLVAVGLVMFVSFKQVTNPVVIFGVAVLEGVLLGAVSKAYAGAFGGDIVPTAVISTLSVFAVMTFLYKSRVIRATPKFMKVVTGAVAGVFVVMLVNLGWTLFTGEPSPMRDGGPVAIGFSLVCIVLAALMFVVNFKTIEDGINAGLPRRFGWLGAVGLLVALVWMYLEILRLLSYFED